MEDSEMAQHTSSKMVDEVVAAAVAPAASAVSVTEVARDTMSEALSFCAQKLNLGHSTQTALGRMLEGDGTASRYWQYGLAKRVAEHLAGWDESVKAVYTTDYDATPEDIVFSTPAQSSPIHLIVWTDRKTAALDSLVAALDGALVKRYAELTGLKHLAHLLDVQVVDDADVEARTGYGAILTSLYNRPIQVWAR